MRRSLLIVALIGAFPLTALAEETVVVQKSVPYATGSAVREAIRTDCDLQAKLATYLKDFAEENGYTVVAVDTFPEGDARPQLELVITDAIGGGGGAWSGPKTVFIEGKYRVEGKVKATFSGHRSSGGGFMAGYKGTCSILGRCVKALGKDVADWLKNPEKPERLGE
ncbi:MAG: hypothetical protein HQK87_02270 [Nitrospinae bacterium]|nr:hypothetical protein [Nitrospinota bacterium]